MSDDVIEHTVTLRIHESMWSNSLEAFRLLRKMLQDAGGTSRLVKNGDVLTFTAKGPSVAVLDAIDNAKRLQKTADEKRRSTVDFLRESLRQGEADRERRREEFLGMVADELLKRKK